jgi:hypothetical protein
MRNIKGSFNGSDIAKEFAGIQNSRENLSRLFAIHAEIGFDGNLSRLVESTNNIAPTGSRFPIGKKETENIEKSVRREMDFCSSSNYRQLKDELDAKVRTYQNEILIAGHIKNGNIRGRLIEYLIAGDDEQLKAHLVTYINDDFNVLPAFKTENTLGDYVRVLNQYHTQTDIKTKLVSKNSNPKAYNIDKFLEFHNRPNTVLLFYFIGIEAARIFNTMLISVYQKDLIQSTLLLNHWAGRNSRGVTQFEGASLHKLLQSPSNAIDEELALSFLQRLYVF